MNNRVATMISKTFRCRNQDVARNHVNCGFLKLILIGLLLAIEPARTEPEHIFPEIFTVGAVLSDTAQCEIFRDAVATMNNEEHLLPTGTRLNASCLKMNANPIVAAEMVCDIVIPSHVYVTLASHALHGDLSPMSVSFTCGFYSIPVIGLFARESSYSDKVGNAILNFSFAKPWPIWATFCI